MSEGHWGFVLRPMTTLSFLVLSCGAPAANHLLAFFASSLPNINTLKLYFYTPAPVFPCRCGQIRRRRVSMRADAIISHTATKWADVIKDRDCCAIGWLKRPKYLSRDEMLGPGAERVLCDRGTASLRGNNVRQSVVVYRRRMCRKLQSTSRSRLLADTSESVTTAKKTDKKYLHVRNNLGSLMCDTVCRDDKRARRRDWKRQNG